MTQALRTKTIVQPGGNIHVVSPDLRAGESVEVIVLQEEQRPRSSISDILRGYPGGRMFKTADEVDRYLKQERDSWGT